MITLDFNPYTASNGTAKIFKHPIVAKFYLLWKSQHITLDLFTKRCEQLCQHINPANEHYDVEDFMKALRQCGLAVKGLGSHRFDTKWVMEHWAYFSPNLRKSVEFKHKFRNTTKTAKIS